MLNSKAILSIALRHWKVGMCPALQPSRALLLHHCKAENVPSHEATSPPRFMCALLLHHCKAENVLEPEATSPLRYMCALLFHFCKAENVPSPAVTCALHVCAAASVASRRRRRGA